jgi:alkaline phosphatase
MNHHASFTRLALGAALLGAGVSALAAPTVSRLTPPSALFTFGDPNPPVIARFLPGQRFDLEATITPDAGQTITSAQFCVDGVPVAGTLTFRPANVTGIPAGTTIASLRAYSNATPGIRKLTVKVVQSDSQTVQRDGNFEIVGVSQLGRRAKNVIFLIGDGMGIAHRTAARTMLHGVQQGKANALLAMDTFPFTGLVMTASLNSIITDSSPGAACYANGNKSNNNQQGVFPDDTTANFDNPRVELIGEYLKRTQGKSLGIVTTSDVFDATPGSFGTHTQSRSAGTGICDQYLDETAAVGGLDVLLGGGRKWFLPNTTPGSARGASTDYVLPADITSAWGVAAGAIDPGRNLINDFVAAGFFYAPDNTTLAAAPAGTKRLLGLFALSNMNVAKDKIDGPTRRDVVPAGSPTGNTIVEDYGFPDQPMLDDMTKKALDVLKLNPNGFTLMVEAASIDKQAHNMDTERWILDTIEFDRAVKVAKDFAIANPDTLIIVTADHECAGVNIIGASRVTNAELVTRSTSGAGIGAGGPRAGVVGAYESAGFPVYTIAADGYPTTTDPDYKMLIGYAGNADRNEDWLTNPLPLRDSQQPFNGVPPLSLYPSNPTSRDTAGGFFLVGATDPANSGASAVHTGSDIPLSAYGRGAQLFSGVYENTDVFFKAMQAVLGGAR